jgi:hypothetical protein
MDDQFSVEVFKDLDEIAKDYLEFIDVPGQHETVLTSDYVAATGLALPDRFDRLSNPV